MRLPLKPIYLLSDSQLLFWRNKGTPFLQSVKEPLTNPSPKAAYIGASNGDDPQFYSIFEAAMQAVDVRDCRMIRSSFSPDDESFVNHADIILLAGGDVEKGWNVFNEVGLKELVIKRHHEGSLLMGVSAGAVQLGLYALVEAEGTFNRLIDTFKLVPFLIGAHEERQGWRGIKEAVRLLDGAATGLGIPAGGGFAYHPDRSIAAIRRPIHEFSVRDGVISHSLLAPNQ